MKRSLKELIGYTIETKDGKSGKVKDILFDEKQWIIRYLEADFGNWFSSKRVLIPRVFLKPTLWDKQVFPVSLSESDIENSFKPDDHLPVSRKYEEEIYKHYGMDPYWLTAVVASKGMYYPPRPVDMPSNEITEDDLNTILRSFNEVEDYQIQAIDGKIGHIEDIIINDENWQIAYVIVDTKNWLPWSKKVLISVEWMETISYVKREVNLKLHTETIKNAPEYHSVENIDPNFEKSLYDYYSRSLVK